MTTISLEDGNLSSVKPARVPISSLQPSTSYTLTFSATSSIATNVNMQFVTHLNPANHSQIVSLTTPESEILHHPATTVALSQGSASYSITITTSAFTQSGVRQQNSWLEINLPSGDPLVQLFWHMEFSSIQLTWISISDGISSVPPAGKQKVGNLYYDPSDGSVSVETI